MSKKTYKLRFYASILIDGITHVRRVEQVFKTRKAMEEGAERISIAYENDSFFRWYSHLEHQLKGEHW